MFAVLTHVDAYCPDEDSDDDDGRHSPDTATNEQEGAESRRCGGDVGETGFDRAAHMPGIISLWQVVCYTIDCSTPPLMIL